MECVLSKDKLREKANNIIADYESFRKGNITRRKLQSSIGYHLSDLRQYEIEEGHYGSRSICIAPNCSPVIDICLLYHTKKGPAKYILTIRPEKGDKYTIYKNKLYYLDLDKYAAPFHNKSLIITGKYQKEKTVSTRTPQFITTSLRTQDSSTQSSFYCATKNRGCCYLQRHHPSSCKDCCLDKDHYGDV